MSQKKRNFAVVIELDRHIEILLLSNDCVIVPELGGFMTHNVEARYDKSDNMFLPPLRTLGFNPQLTMNDSLLAQSYVEAYDVSYPEAVRRIENEVKELKQHLETEGYYDLTDIGVLKLNDEGHYEFSPCEAGILTPGLYGLSSFEMLPLKQDENEKDLSGTTNQDDDERAIIIKMSWIRTAVAVAAAILAFFFITTPIANSDMSQVQSSSILPIPIPTTDPGRQKTVVTIHEDFDTVNAIANDDNTLAVLETEEENPAAAIINDSAPTEGRYCIVLASQVSKANAENFVNELAKKGLTDACVFTRNNMVRVVYGSYHTESEAYNALRSLRNQDAKDFSEAWVLEK